MPRVRVLLALSALSLVTFLGSAPARAADVASDAAFLVVYRPGPGWLEGKPLAEQPLLEHGRYLLDLYAQGKMKSAGPFTDDSGGAMVLQAADLQEARRLVADDPAVVKGVLVPEIRQWTLQPWEQFLAKRQARERTQQGAQEQGTPAANSR
jgi:uncharacterized protein YciI